MILINLKINSNIFMNFFSIGFGELHSSSTRRSFAGLSKDERSLRQRTGSAKCYGDDR